MKKLNNKGFAVSTILYGLLVVLILITTLIMSTMAFTRKQSKELTENIIRELEKSGSTGYSEVNICNGEAEAIRIKNMSCDDIIDNLKQKAFAKCFNENQGDESACNISLIENSDVINNFYTSCQNETNSRQRTAEISCCFHKLYKINTNMANDSTFSNCANGTLNS